MHAILATGFNQPDKVSFYNVVLFLHVLSAIVAFGITFTYPLIFASLTRNGNLRHLAWGHRTQVQIERFILSPAATLLLLCGIYMASDGIYGWKSTFVSVGLAGLIVIMGLLGGVLIPAEVKAAKIAERATHADRGDDRERARRRHRVLHGHEAGGALVARVGLRVDQATSLRVIESTSSQ
jgi:uncharacterized membrane protein